MRYAVLVISANGDLAETAARLARERRTISSVVRCRPDELRARLRRGAAPDAILTDEASFAAVALALAAAHRARPELRVRALVVGDNSLARIAAAAQAFAAGYVARDASPREIADAVHEALSGEQDFVVSRSLRDARLIPASPHASALAGQTPVDAGCLSAREREVYAQLLLRRTNKQIGEALFISHWTAKEYVESVLHKLGLAHRTQLWGPMPSPQIGSPLHAVC